MNLPCAEYRIVATVNVGAKPELMLWPQHALSTENIDWPAMHLPVTAMAEFEADELRALGERTA